MLRAIYTAATGMSAQEMNLDNVANNLANSSTAGFRKRRLQFEDLLYQNIVMPGAASTQQTTVAAGLRIGLGSRSAASEIVQTQGDFSSTGNPMDLAIRGQGFFQVRTIQIALFPNPGGLNSVGKNLFLATTASRTLSLCCSRSLSSCIPPRN